MTHPIYNARPPIMGDDYDGEHDDEMEELRDLLYAFIDLSTVAVTDLKTKGKSHRRELDSADAILVTGDEWGAGEELFVRATSFNKWFPRPLDRFLVLYNLWQHSVFRETSPEFYSARPPAIVLFGRQPQSYFIWNWRSLLEMRFDDKVDKKLSGKRKVPKFARSAADLEHAKDRFAGS